MMSIRTIFWCLAAMCVFSACTENTLSPTTPPASSTTPAPTIFGLTGQVVQAGTTTGIASAALLLVDSSGNAMNAVSDSTGAFAFGVTLASGNYTLQTTAPGYRPSVAIIAIPATSLTVQLPLLGASPVTTLAVNVTGQSALTVGQSTQLTANVVYTDGTQKDVTTVAKWSSTNPSVAAVSISGVLTAYFAGTTAVTASFQDVSGSLNVSVASR
jgi:hypothetical protein